MVFLDVVLPCEACFVPPTVEQEGSTSSELQTERWTCKNPLPQRKELEVQ